MSLTPNAIIVHGMPGRDTYYNPAFPSASNFAWLPWLQKQFTLHDILAETPEMPRPYIPQYEEWRAVFERYPITPETHLVGHSCGAGFLVRWLSEHPDVKVGHVVFVAPWLGDDGVDSEGMDPNFFNFTLDPNLADHTAVTSMIYSTDDEVSDLNSAIRLENELNNLKLLKFTDRGHFVNVTELPEILPLLKLTQPQGE